MHAHVFDRVLTEASHSVCHPVSGLQSLLLGILETILLRESKFPSPQVTTDWPDAIRALADSYMLLRCESLLSVSQHLALSVCAPELLARL